jgi:hypothetical protein
MIGKIHLDWELKTKLQQLTIMNAYTLSSNELTRTMTYCCQK